MPFYDRSHDFAIDGVRIVRREAGPCPICGHPTGDCSESSNSAPVRIIGADTFPSLGHEDVFIVEEDVYEERQITPFTKANILVVKAGQRISMSKAKELGLV